MRTSPGCMDNCPRARSNRQDPAVAFDNGLELQAKVGRFLADDEARIDIAASMRAAVIERCSYANINRRLLEMIRANLATQQKRCAA